MVIQHNQQVYNVGPGPFYEYEQAGDEKLMREYADRFYNHGWNVILDTKSKPAKLRATINVPLMPDGISPAQSDQPGCFGRMGSFKEIK
jgi:hypothetical protein